MADEVVPIDDTCKKIELLDKLENFKRYTIAIGLLSVFAISILFAGLLACLMAWKGDIAGAAELSKWIVGIMVGVTAGIIGFYFGSKSTSSEMSPK